MRLERFLKAGWFPAVAEDCDLKRLEVMMAGICREVCCCCSPMTMKPCVAGVCDDAHRSYDSSSASAALTIRDIPCKISPAMSEHI